MKLTTELWLPATVEHPTADGRTLRLAPGGSVHPSYTFELSVHRPPPVDAEPRDIIEHRAWIADADGTVWTAASRFTSSWLVEQLAAAVFENARLLAYYDREPSVHAAFAGGLLLDAVQYGSDDRLYRSLLLEGRRMQCIFKYTTLRFDVAAQSGHLGRLQLFARLHADCLDCFQSADDEERTRLSSALVFELDHPSVLITRNTAVEGPEPGEWNDSPLALPLRWERVSDGAPPQACVTVV
jgi:hypothetical protein